MSATSTVPATVAHLAFWRILALGVLMYVVPGLVLGVLAIWQVDAAQTLALHIIEGARNADTVVAAP